MSLYISVLLSSVVALYCIYKRKLTLPAVIFAWLCGITIGYLAGYFAFATLIATCFIILLTDRIKKDPKDNQRGIQQITSRFLLPTISIILYYLLGNEGFYTMFYATMAVCLGDTLASSIGALAKKKPINIFTQEKIEKGASGGITLLGTIASIFGGIIVGGLYFIQTANIISFLAIILLSLVGSMIDSILGLSLQAQYRCFVCKKVVEEKRHCRKKPKLIRGFAFMDNNLVNLLSNLLIFLISYLIFVS